MTSRQTLVGLALVLIVIVVISAFMLMTISHSIRRAKVAGCASNLHLLWQSRFNYAQPYGGHQAQIGSVATGEGFWLELQRGSRPVLDGYESYVCPLTDDVPELGGCSYRGPAININKLRPDDPCGADKLGNHGKGNGGNVLIKTGNVVEVTGADPLWIWAGETTKE